MKKNKIEIFVFKYDHVTYASILGIGLGYEGEMIDYFVININDNGVITTFLN